MGKAEWSTLPPELLREISRKLATVFEFVRFRAVCRSWRSVAKPADLTPQLPWLFLPCKLDTNCCIFFSPVTGDVHRFPLPEARGKRICGSRDGWLALVDDRTNALTLLQPLTGSHISLPPLGIKRKLVSKVILSSSPTSASPCVVTVFFVGAPELGFCRLGPDGWSQWSEMDTWLPCGIRDVVYHHGKFYAINGTGLLAICDAGSKAMPLQMVPGLASMILSLCTFRRFYCLVESSGELLLAHKHSRDYFELYRLDESGEPRWNEVESIGNQALFLCNAQSFSISASNLLGCRGNHMYLANCSGIGDTMVSFHVFKVKDGSIKQLDKRDYLEEFRSEPVWIVPSLCQSPGCSS